jgi:uncharacterized protein YecT (DUF1311 family)
MENLFKKYLSKVVIMKVSNSYKKIAGSVFAFVYILTTLAYAIDNPDAPDYLGEFKSRERIYLEKINNPKNTNRAYLIAYDNYLIFLDKELNAVYRLLMSKLSEVHQGGLKNSQKKWIVFRDAEFELINNYWTRNNFGSSAVISRGAYRSSIVRNRVIQLLQYASN